MALETVRAMDGLLGTEVGRGLEVTLLAPGGATVPAFENIAVRNGGLFNGGYAWEQCDLPRLALGGVLLNLCNLGPVLKHRQVVVVHDATPRVMPEAFSLAFRLTYRVLVPLLGVIAARLVTISEFSRREITRWYGIPGDRLAICAEGGEHILRQPADQGVLREYGLEGRRFFLAVGVGSRNKNTELVAAAFERAGLADVHLVMTGKREGRVHQGADDRTFASNVIHYVGHVSDAGLRALYEHALALVYPSRYEGFGLPPLEAMTCGCPVVISDQPALLEIAGGSEAVLVTGMDDVVGLAGKMVQLAQDAGLRRRLSDHGRAHAARFTWASTAAGLLKLCREAA
ncbi:MAG: glycosyltransferase family 4 protein [Enhydrobacter sp.]|nr:glycosyltransferase family 4 protein [Enhydrobacter sp.]